MYSLLVTQLRVQHVPRSANGNVHLLAKYVLASKESVVWLDSFPADVACIFNSLD